MIPELTPLNLSYKVYGIEDVKLLIRDYSKEGFTEVRPDDPRVISQEIQYFISDEKKLLIDNTAPYFHLLLVWLYPLLKELSESLEPVTIIFRHKSSSQQIIDNHLGSVTDYLVERFVSMGHKVDFLNEKTNSFYINNFNLYSDSLASNINSVSVIAKFLSKNLDYSKKPFEKLYLSRAKTIVRSSNAGLDVYTRNSRINDPDVLEEYFKSLGFRIIFPEDLSSFQDQLQLIASTRILMSVTSASLATSIVMSPGNSIVELSYPLAPALGSDGASIDNSVFHDHYKTIATVSKSTYIAVPHQGSALDLIDYIEGNIALKSFLSS